MDADQNLVVRPARDEDAPALALLARRAYQPYVERMDREPAPMNADYGEAIRAGEAWAAERDGSLVGLLIVRVQPDHLLLENVAVAPEAQNVGIGGQLIRLAEERARVHGLAGVRLYTNEAMTENLEHYRARGYRETHRATEDGYRRVHFAKALRPYPSRS